MSARGRPPKPTHLKVLAGNPGKRPLNNNEPKPKPIAPKPPSWLDSVAKKEWKRIAPELERLGLLTQVDGAALEAYCSAYALFVFAQKRIKEHLKEHGKLTMPYTNKGGGTNEVPIPEVAIMEKSLKIMKSFLTEFGLSPSSRSRLNLPEQQEEDEFEAFLHARRSGH